MVTNTLPTATAAAPPAGGLSLNALRIRLALGRPVDGDFARRYRAAQLRATVAERLRSL